MTETGDSSVCVAEFGAAHGVKGAVRLFSYTENPERVFSYPLRSPALSGSVTLRRAGTLKGGFIVFVDGIESRTEAERLTGAKLYTDRSAFPANREKDAYYVRDLIGMRVTDTEGAPLGAVVAAHNFGAQDLIEIREDGPGKPKTRMLAFTDDFIEKVDIEAGIIVANPPEEVYVGEEAER
jgi:16S rRNA processing protein RimM